MPAKYTRKSPSSKTNVARPNNQSRIKASYRISGRQLGVVIGLMLALGVFIIWRVFAGSLIATEVESWTPSSSSGVAIKADTAASGGNYMEFLAPPATSTTVTQPAVGLWKPTADKQLKLNWNLDGAGLDVNKVPSLPAEIYEFDGDYNPASSVAKLHSLGKKVICYFDGGVYETYRADASKFPKSIIGKQDVGWAGSYWLDIRQVAILEPIMRARIQNCKDKGFDAVDPDEVTNWSNVSGFPLSYQDQITYNRAMASWAHAAGLSIALKGDLEQAHDLAQDYDFTLNEECYMYGECSSVYNPADGKNYPGLQSFTQLNKAVWIAEYPEEYKAGALNWANTCLDANKNRWNVAQYSLGLPANGIQVYCPTGW